MAPESKHNEVHQHEKADEHKLLTDQPAAEEAAPEAFVSGLDTLERSLQGIAGNGVQFSMDHETRAQNLLALQQAVGNRTVQRVIQRQNTPAPAPGITPPTGLPAAPPSADTALPEDLRAFRARGAMPAAAPGTMIASGGGGFSARYDPIGMALTITLNLGMNFIDGMRISGNQVTAVNASMNDSAVQMNNVLSGLSGERLTQAMARVREQWLWTGASDPRIATWMADYRANVTTAWSSGGAGAAGGTGIIFQGSRTGWDTQLARVNVVVNTQNITSLAAGTPIPGPQPVHCRADIYKTPDEDVFGAQVTAGASGAGLGPRAPGLLELGSGQVRAQSHILTQSIFFDNDSSTLNADATDKLTKWVISFQSTPGTPGNSVSITGRANTTGETTRAGRRRNDALSLARARAVEHYIKTTSVEGSLLRNAATRVNSVTGAGTTGAGEEDEWRRVDIVVGTGQGQNIAAHEFGHMLGLGDEYASTPLRDASGAIVHDTTPDQNEISRGLVSGTGGDVGTTASHNQVASDMGLGGAVHENNDNIMSLGSTIRPQHYATFMLALHNVTGINEWRVKP